MANSAPPQPSGQATINGIAASAGLSPQDLQALLANQSAANDPFHSNMGQMSLYTGDKVVPGQMGSSTSLVPWDSRHNQRLQTTFAGHKVDVTLPGIPKNWHVEIHSDMQDSSHAGEAEQRAANLWLEVFDDQGHSVQRTPLTPEQKDQIIGHTSIGPMIGDGKSAVNASLESPKPQGREASLVFRWADLHQEKDVVPGSPDTHSDNTNTIASELKTVYDLPAKAVANLKTKLWLAGYYGTKKLGEINMNSITDDDIAGLSSVMLQAARYYAAGKKMTWQQLLDQEATDPAAGKNGSSWNTVSLTDPQAITQEANSTAEKILGRAPSNSDVQTLIQLIHGKENAAGDAANANADSADTVDPTAQVEEYFRTKYPNEAHAVDYGSRAQIWEQMLGSTTPNPGVVHLGQ